MIGLSCLVKQSEGLRQQAERHVVEVAALEELPNRLWHLVWLSNQGQRVWFLELNPISFAPSAFDLLKY